MDFALSDEQTMLGETVARFVADCYDFTAREHALKSPEGWSREVWSGLAELGVLALPFAEADGGFGFGGVETMVVMEALGQGLVVEPYFASIVLAGAVLRRTASTEQRASLVPALMSGESILALAHSETGLARHCFDARTSAKRHGAGWLLDGRKIAVLHGQSADRFIVSAMTDAGLSLFMAARDLPGISVEAARGYDGVPVAEVAFAGVELDADALLGGKGGGAAALDAAFDEATAALVAEAVGVMTAAFDQTVDYLKTRKQFDVPIGSFQALQHRTVEMLIELELARSMAILAATSLDLEPDQRRRNVSAAKAQIGKSGRVIGQEAVQMHGAIGITAELKVGHAFKRLTAIDALLGNRDWHLARIAELGGVYPAS